MGKKRLVIVCIFIVQVLICAAPGRGEVTFLRRSESLISGENSELGASFLAETGAPGEDRVQIRFNSGKVVAVELDQSAGTLSVRSFNEPGQGPAEISEADIYRAQLLLAELAQHAPSSPVELTLISTLNLVTEARPGSILDIQTRLEPVISEKATKSLCASAGKKVKATYDDDKQNKTFTESVLLGPCYNQKNSCLGRCGLGCGVLGSGVEQQLTQDCLNHDLCKLRTGSNVTPPCDDEFVAASDDFFVARDCASMTGSWSDQYKLGYKLAQAPNGLISGRVSDEKCGSYSVSGVHSDAKARFTASRLFPPSGCCSSWSFEGTYSGCDKISGNWTNRCELRGGLRMTRGKVKEEAQGDHEGESNPFKIGGEESH